PISRSASPRAPGRSRWPAPWRRGTGPGDRPPPASAVRRPAPGRGPTAPSGPVRESRARSSSLRGASLRVARRGELDSTISVMTISPDNPQGEGVYRDLQSPASARLSDPDAPTGRPGHLSAMPPTDAPDSAPRLARFAWFTVAANLLVILWGAFVRASGSGAGCGNHWPLCNGEVVPPSPTLATVIEFTHRLTSGVALLLVVALVVGARRALPRGHRVRAAAWVCLGVMILEALIGAGLVRFELVADNASMARALTLGAHLLNTLVLLAALVLTALWAGGAPPLRWREAGRSRWLLGLG